jgi:hypothetical protein
MYRFKVDGTLDVLILNFDICGFFGLGEFFDLHSVD